MIDDLDEKHQSKIYEIIEKHQPTLLSGSTECDIEVRHAARLLLCGCMLRAVCLPRRTGQRLVQVESLDNSTLMELRDLCERVQRCN